jgi:hypothetical protein
MWQSSPDYCSVDASDEAVAVAVAMPIECVRNAIAEIQNAHAPLLKAERGRWISNGLRKEADKQIERRGKAKANADARWKNALASKTNANASISQCSSSSTPSPTPTSSIHTHTCTPVEFIEAHRTEYLEWCHQYGLDAKEHMNAIAIEFGAMTENNKAKYGVKAIKYAIADVAKTVNMDRTQKSKFPVYEKAKPGETPEEKIARIDRNMRSGAR